MKILLRLSSCENSGVAWSSYHATYKRNQVETVGASSILPLLQDKVHTLDMKYHCLDIMKDTVSQVNQNQTPLDVCDQPVYALTKQIN